MAYVSKNVKSKKALRDAVANGETVTVYGVGLSTTDYSADGDYGVEGPHYPAAHSWYGKVRVRDGKVVKVLS